MSRSARILRCAGLVGVLAAVGCELDTTDPLPTEPMTLVGADLESRLWVVDETNGGTTFLDSVFIQYPPAFPPPPPRPIGAIASIVWVPTAGMWWVGSARSSICENCLYEFLPQADSARLVRRLIEEVDSLADFAVHPTTGRLYTFKRGSGGYLFRVDLSDVLFREVMQVDEGVGGKGSTFWTDGRLYVSGGQFQQVLTRVDIERAATSQVGPVTYVGFPPFASAQVRILSMATRSDGVIFGLVLDNDATYLATVDPTNAVVMNLGGTAQQMSALAYIPTRLIPEI
jgi:hypothetical protein